MDIAFCILDKKEYSIQAFERLSREEIQSKRKFLECVDCSGTGYYRRKSIDGKKACFGANHLRADCPAKSTSEREQEAIEEQVVKNDVQRVLASHLECIVDFEDSERKTDSGPASVDTDGTLPRRSRSGKSHVINPPKTRTPSYKLRTWLSYARANEGDYPDVICHVDGYPRHLADLLVRLEEAAPSDRPHLYWGIIQHADPELNWLNTGGKDRVSILISKCRAKFKRKYRIDDHEDCPGRYVILFGWCNESKNGKLYIEVKDPTRIFLTAQR